LLSFRIQIQPFDFGDSDLTSIINSTYFQQSDFRGASGGNKSASKPEIPRIDKPRRILSLNDNSDELPISTLASGKLFIQMLDWLGYINKQQQPFWPKYTASNAF
jgi:hypothetical protein